MEDDVRCNVRKKIKVVRFVRFSYVIVYTGEKPNNKISVFLQKAVVNSAVFCLLMIWEEYGLQSSA